MGEGMFGMKKKEPETIAPAQEMWVPTGRRRFVRWNKHFGMTSTFRTEPDYIFYPQIEEQRPDIVSGKSGIDIRWRDGAEADLPGETIV